MAAVGALPLRPKSDARRAPPRLRRYSSLTDGTCALAHDVDRLVLTPDDIDLSRSPLAGCLDAETYVLGAFNPGLTRLPNGNLLMMVRIAEALRTPIQNGNVHAIRWDGGSYVRD